MIANLIAIVNNPTIYLDYNVKNGIIDMIKDYAKQCYEKRISDDIYDKYMQGDRPMRYKDELDATYKDAMADSGEYIDPDDFDDEVGGPGLH